MGSTLRGTSRLLDALALATPLALVTAPAHAADTCAGQPATVVGTAGVDRLVGTPGPDVIVGLDGDDVIDGRGGDDLVCGDDGSDLLRGGDGRDQLYGGLGGIVLDRFGDPMVMGDVLYGGPGDDLFDGGLDDRAPEVQPDQVRYGTATRGVVVDLEKLTGRGQGADRFTAQTWHVIGSRYADRVLGSDLADHLEGRAGDDLLAGRGGNDWLEADFVDSRRQGTGADTVYGGVGNDEIQSEAGADHLFGGPGRDELFDLGVRGADRLFGGPGKDYLDDVLSDNAGQRLAGGPGQDQVLFRTHIVRGRVEVHPAGTADLRTGTGQLRWSGRRLRFTVTSAESFAVPPGVWTVYGTSGSDELWGSSPARVYGRGGDDVLWGSERGDFLYGGPGHDTAHPLGGRDTCVSIETSLASEGGCEVRR